MLLNSGAFLGFMNEYNVVQRGFEYQFWLSRDLIQDDRDYNFGYTADDHSDLLNNILLESSYFTLNSETELLVSFIT